MLLQGTKTCLITGAAFGLGFEFAKLAAADHCDLLLLDKNGEKLAQVKRYLEETYSVSVQIYQIDLSDPAACSFLKPVVENHAIDILINNAGFGLYGKFEVTDWKYEEQMIHLHVLNLTFLTKKVIETMLRRKSGKVMNISSVAAFLPGPFSSVYYATKAYMKSFSMSIAHEVRSSGVTVTVFCPGKLNTRFAAEMASISHSNITKISLSVVDLEKAAKAGYRGMLKGKVIIIPGFFNKLIVLLSHLLPAESAASLNCRIQQKIRKG